MDGRMTVDLDPTRSMSSIVVFSSSKVSLYAWLSLFRFSLKSALADTIDFVCFYDAYDQ